MVILDSFAVHFWILDVSKPPKVGNFTSLIKKIVWYLHIFITPDMHIFRNGKEEQNIVLTVVGVHDDLADLKGLLISAVVVADKVSSNNLDTIGTLSITTMGGGDDSGSVVDGATAEVASGARLEGDLVGELTANGSLTTYNLAIGVDKVSPKRRRTRLQLC
jgi:hypothetical protein